MTRAELAKGSATFLMVIVAGFLSTTYVDRHFAAAKANQDMAQAPSSSACVGEDGAWKNWPWPNVPTLSPKCAKRR
jgi:hypothetical protein